MQLQNFIAQASENIMRLYFKMFNVKEENSCTPTPFILAGIILLVSGVQEIIKREEKG